jgi:ubiquitin carboxyl-terminal hydrolase 16/45
VCKKVSVTNEEFNDLSLSIKPEDYARVSRRDRLRKFAQKLKLPRRNDAPASTDPAVSPEPVHSMSGGLDVPRATSVPPSPMTADKDVEASLHAQFELMHTAPRRRSVDASTTAGGLRGLAASTSAPAPTTVTGKASRVPSRSDKPAPAPGVEPSSERGRKPAPKDSDDNWTKLGRRLSLAMRRPKDVAGGSKERASSRPTSTERSAATAPIPATRQSPTLLPRAQSPLPSLSAAVSPLLAPTPLKPKPHASASTAKRKPQEPPKPSKAEAAYLRRILADVAGTSTNPLAAFLGAGYQPTSGDGGLLPSGAVTLALWSRVSQLTTIEECLRMFTAVEVLDDENKVGCWRCWKIAHGVYRPRKDPMEQEEEDDDEGDDEHNDQDSPANPAGVFAASRTLSSTSSTPSDLQLDSEPTNSVTSLSSLASSAAVHVKGDIDEPLVAPKKSFYLQSAAAGLSIPKISTTAPESPDTPRVFPNNDDTATPVRTSGTLIPPSRPWTHVESGTASDSDAYDLDASEGLSSRDISRNASPAASPNSSAEHLVLPRGPNGAGAGDAPRAKRVIFQRAYKRYLLARPPPILVVHLKRFQQMTKLPTVSFASSFRKLDEFVAFPETLDMTPFLAPRKEDFGLGKSRDPKVGKDRKQEGSVPDRRCVYRLYAVVEHIGHMVSVSLCEHG